MTETERITNEVLARQAHKQELVDSVKVLGVIAAGLDIDAAKARLASDRAMYERMAEIVRESQFGLLVQIPADDPLEVNEILAFGYPHGTVLIDGPAARVRNKLKGFRAWLNKPIDNAVLEGIVWGLAIVAAGLLMALLMVRW